MSSQSYSCPGWAGWHSRREGRLATSPECPALLGGEDLASLSGPPSWPLSSHTSLPMRCRGAFFQRALTAPKMPLPLFSPRSWVPPTLGPSRVPPTPTPCPSPQLLGRGLSSVTSALPLRHLSHCLGIGDLAGPEEVASGGMPGTASGKKGGHLSKWRAAAQALARAGFESRLLHFVAE